MSITPQSNIIYENISMLDQEENFLCYVSSKKAKWYTSRGLAVWVNPQSFKLLFKNNNTKIKPDKFYTQKLKNRCVVCGEKRTDKLNKHHVIPSMFRKEFPDQIKSFDHHDVLVVCIDCHTKYEILATKFKTELAIKYGIDTIIKIDPNEKRFKNIISARKLIENINSGIIKDIPEQRREYLLELSKQPLPIVENKTKKSWAKILVDIVISTSSLESFCKLWRTHFVENTNPKYLPDHWSIGHFKKE